ncbi:hypothetical protein CONPUDRAFT_146603, partial [Coniophora puteana RWD-64-598 SS2]
MTLGPRGEENPAVEFMRGPLIGSLIGMGAYPGDRWSLKLLYHLQTGLCTTLFIRANAKMSPYLVREFMMVFTLGGAYSEDQFLTDFVVYIYFMWKIWTSASHTKNMASFIDAPRNSRKDKLKNELWVDYRSWVFPLNLAGNMLFIVGDVFSSAILAYHLRKHLDIRKGSSLNRLLYRLVVYTVATGTLTSLLDIVALALTIDQKGDTAYTSIVIFQNRIYANSLLASVNMRKINLRSLSSPLDPDLHLEIMD